MTKVLRLRAYKESNRSEVKDRNRRRAKVARRAAKEGLLDSLARRSDPMWRGDR